MLIKKTIIKNSLISGVGLFADEFISKNDLVWIFNPEIDIKVDEAKWKNFPDHVVNYLLSHTWVCEKTGNRYCSIDNDKFMNHSENPNLSMNENGSLYANKEITLGEELLCNYYEIHKGDIWEGS